MTSQADATGSSGRPQTTVEVRVRYAECDPMNIAHHSAYPVWMEIARTELLREMGVTYKDIEAGGIFCAVARLSIRYRRPVLYDDVISITVTALPCRGAKIEHEYRIERDGTLLATAETTLACIDRDGQLQPVPEALQFKG